MAAFPVSLQVHWLNNETTDPIDANCKNLFYGNNNSFALLFEMMNDLRAINSRRPDINRLKVWPGATKSIIEKATEIVELSIQQQGLCECSKNQSNSSSLQAHTAEDEWILIRMTAGTAKLPSSISKSSSSTGNNIFWLLPSWVLTK